MPAVCRVYNQQPQWNCAHSLMARNEYLSLLAPLSFITNAACRRAAPLELTVPRFDFVGFGKETIGREQAAGAAFDDSFQVHVSQRSELFVVSSQHSTKKKYNKCGNLLLLNSLQLILYIWYIIWCINFIWYSIVIWYIVWYITTYWTKLTNA